MVTGAFKMIKHDHHFKVHNETTIMIDRFEYESPMGWFGRIFNILILDRYMRTLLIQRNSIIKEYAESLKWKTIIT